jgi:hypothetical protein
VALNVAAPSEPTIANDAMRAWQWHDQWPEQHVYGMTIALQSIAEFAGTAAVDLPFSMTLLQLRVLSQSGQIARQPIARSAFPFKSNCCVT